MRKSIELGKNGEKLIADFLINEGYEVVARNWRIKGGEIDLIALAPDGLIIFVEVKSRSSAAYGHPLEAITPDKQSRLIRLSLAWLIENKKWNHPYRIDCAAVLMSSPPQIDYRPGVI